MFRVLRIASMWLLALALPVQGFAAASMSCGPGHGSAMGMPSAHSHVADVHEYAGGTVHHGHDAGPQADLDRHPVSNSSDHGDVTKADATSKVAKGSCSACASCCMGAALRSATLSFQATPVADSFVSLVPRIGASFLTDGPERPPRPVLV